MDQVEQQNKKMGSPFPHIGNMVDKKMREQRVTNAEVARRLGVTSMSVQNYLLNESLQFRILWKIGLVLEHNFLADLMDFLPENIVNSGTSVFHEKMNAQVNEIADLKKEIEIYKGILIKR